MNKNVLQNCGFFFTVLFYMVVFISKPAMNITAGIALVCSMFYIFLFNRDIIKQQKFLLFLILPFIAGIVLSLFSERFLSGPLMFMNRYKFMLLFIPLALFADTKKKFAILIAAVIFSGLSAIGYGVYNGRISYATFKGFLKIGRTADMMMMLSLIMASLFFTLDSQKKILKTVLFILLCLFSSAMVLSGIRGAFLGFFFGIAVLLFITKKKSIVFCVVAFLIIGLFNFSGFKKDLSSIIETKSNISNSTRIQLLVTGLAFVYNSNDILFGIGVENSEKTFKEFILSHDEDYQKKYQLALHHSRDFHNSYLQILIECGIFFLVLFLSSLLFLLFQLFKSLKSVEKDQKPIVICAIVVSSSFLISQIFHSELYSYGSSLFYLILFGGCQASSQFINQLKSVKLIWSKIERNNTDFSHNFNI